MITHIPANLNGTGLVAHWLVSDPTIDLTISHQQEGYAKARVTTSRKGVVVDDREFTTGDRVVIALLTPGTWNYESSSNGRNYNMIAPLNGGPNMRVQVIMDAQPGMPEVWGRCTLVSPLSPVPPVPPAPVPPVATPSPVIVKKPVTAAAKTKTKSKR